jgi:beta-glucosidase
MSTLNRRDLLRTAAAGSGLVLAGSLLGCSRREGTATVPVPAPAPSGPKYRFPDNFLWGAGNSGLQHEGSPLADGAGPSAMYRWAHKGVKQKVPKPSWSTPPIDTFDVTADCYRRYRSDIQLMRELNFRAFNFEVYWPRIQPEGTGKVNQAGLDFYDGLVDEFLKAGIVPLCNLYVFDHPAALHDRGGWFNRDMADWFADYASILFKQLGDRVPYWTTICELDIWQLLSGVEPVPGKWWQQPSADIRATHHLLLGQGRAVQAFRASGAKGEIGNQHLTMPTKPASDSEADVSAAARADARTNGMLLDPQLRGEYPRILVDWFGAKWPDDAIKDGDLATISAPIDFFGMDYYGSQTIRHDPSKEGGALQTATAGGESNAEGIRDALVLVRERYGRIPIFLLEIGEAVEDKVEDGKIDDPGRSAYHHNLLTGAHRAISEGVDLRACFIWSMHDGWEFGWGLSRRYGLVRVDPQTQERTIKASGYWYRDLIAANGFDDLAVSDAPKV